MPAYCFTTIEQEQVYDCGMVELSCVEEARQTAVVFAGDVVRDSERSSSTRAKGAGDR